MAKADAPTTEQPTADDGRTNATLAADGVDDDVVDAFAAVIETARALGIDDGSIDVRLKIAASNAQSFADDEDVAPGRHQLRQVDPVDLGGFFDVVIQTAVRNGVDPATLSQALSAQRDRLDDSGGDAQ